MSTVSESEAIKEIVTGIATYVPPVVVDRLNVEFAIMRQPAFGEARYADGDVGPLTPERDVLLVTVERRGPSGPEFLAPDEGEILRVIAQWASQHHAAAMLAGLLSEHA